MGDPQADGGPNAELVESFGPIRVTPLRNLPQGKASAAWMGLPHFAGGGVGGGTAEEEDDDDDSVGISDDGATAGSFDDSAYQDEDGQGENSAPADASGTMPMAPPSFVNGPQDDATGNSTVRSTLPGEFTYPEESDSERQRVDDWGPSGFPASASANGGSIGGDPPPAPDYFDDPVPITGFAGESGTDPDVDSIGEIEPKSEGEEDEQSGPARTQGNPGALDSSNLVNIGGNLYDPNDLLADNNPGGVAQPASGATRTSSIPKNIIDASTDPKVLAKTADKKGVFQVNDTDKVTIDHDSDPYAYIVRGQKNDDGGTDRLDNASYDEKYIDPDSLDPNIILKDKKTGKWVTQHLDGYDYYVSKTAWFDNAGDAMTDYPDGTKTPYIAISDAWADSLGAVKGKSFFLVQNLSTGKSTIVIYADSRGKRKGSIEVSPAAAKAVGIVYNRNGVTSFGGTPGAKGPQGIKIIFLGNAPSRIPVKDYQP